jgi:hypothetical protein
MSHHLHPEATLALVRLRTAEIRDAAQKGPHASFPRRRSPRVWR